MKMESVRPKILVSACLVGCRSRYDAALPEVIDKRLSQWMEWGLVLPFCPETAGGLAVPRPPAEISRRAASDGKVFTCSGEDVTENFVAGAKNAVTAVRFFGIQAAVLKDGSPSCGLTWIYDGFFRNKRIPGRGIAAALLAANKIALFNEINLALLEDWVAKEI